MISPARIAAFAALLVVPLAACSSDGGGTAGSSVTASVDGSSASTPADGSSATTATGSDVTGAGSTSEVAATSSTAAGGATTVATQPGPEESDPFASTPPPDPTDAPDAPPPPADDCIDAAAGPASVELVVDDDHVRYAGEIAPSCVRIHAAQQLVIRSVSVIGATVQVGEDSHELDAGGSFTVPAVGTNHEVGDVFEVFVEDLDISVLVQVLP